VHGARDLEPLLAADLQVVRELLHALAEDLRAAAGDRAEPGSTSSGSTSASGFFAFFAIWSSSTIVKALMWIDGRALFTARRMLEVVRVLELRVDARDHVHLGHGLVELLADLLRALLGRPPVRALLPGRRWNAQNRQSLLQMFV
jgi:hypothetical protein